MDGVGTRESWGSVAEPGESGGGEEEWEIGGTAASEGMKVEVFSIAVAPTGILG